MILLSGPQIKGGHFCAKNGHLGRPALARPPEVRSAIRNSEVVSQNPKVGSQKSLSAAGGAKIG